MDSTTAESPFAAIKAQQQAISQPAPTINGNGHDHASELPLTPDAMATAAEPLLEAEESAGGPPMPSAAAPAVSAVRDIDGDVVMHEADGQVRPPEESADRLGGGGDMPGHSRELGNGPEVDERAPPLTADIEQPTGPSERVDAQMQDPAPLPTAAPVESSSAVAHPMQVDLPPAPPLPPTLAPSTLPGAASEVPTAAVSNASAPPTPGGIAEATASAPAPTENPFSPTSSKRAAEEDEQERDSKRPRQDAESNAATLASLAAPASQLPAPAAEAPAAPVAPTPDASAPAAPQADAAQPPVPSTSSMPIPRYPSPPLPAVAMPPASNGPASYPAAPHTAPASYPPTSYSQIPSYPAEQYSAPTTVSPAQLASPFSHSPAGYADPSAAPSLPPVPAKMPKEHQRFAEGVMKTLRKQPASYPFLLPVDPVALNIPTYFDHIKQPMDIGTVEKKLKQTKYGNVDEWIADVRLIFWNCYRFNGQPGPTAPVSISAKAVEDVFEKQLPKLPKAKPPKPAPPPKAARPPPSPMRDPSPTVKRRPSNALPTIRRTSNGGGDRDKRTIRAPQPYEPDYDDGPLSARPRKFGRQTEQMRYCREVLRELTKKSNEAFTFPFLHPVDYVTLNIPDYPRIVKRPMDLSTVRKKFDAGEYQVPEDFEDDIRLILKNCFLYNPAGTPVHEMGRKVEQIFDSKMMGMPEPGEYDDESFGEDGFGDDKIKQMEMQLNAMRDNLALLKSQKSRAGSNGLGNSLGRSKGKAPAAIPPRPRPSAEHARRRSSAGASAANSMYAYGEDWEEEEAVQVAPRPQPVNEVSFEMKRELATKITTFEGAHLDRAIEIIRNSAPDLLGDESKEIELDIDMLDGGTLLKLYNFVVLGKGMTATGAPSPTSPKKSRPESLTAAGTKAQKSGRAGTGGLKGQVLDEEAESARIAALEAKLEREYSGLANNAGNGSGTTPTPTAGTRGSAPATVPPAPASESSDDDGDSSDED